MDEVYEEQLKMLLLLLRQMRNFVRRDRKSPPLWIRSLDEIEALDVVIAAIEDCHGCREKFLLQMKLTKEKVDLLVNGTRDKRVYACARPFKLFALYYFTQYFSFKAAPFHEYFFQDFEDLVTGKADSGVWLA